MLKMIDLIKLLAIHMQEAYISNRVDLRILLHHLKLLVVAYRHPSADFRVLYQLFREDGAETELSYELLPLLLREDTDGDGFGDKVIDSSKNSGRPDAFVLAVNFDEFEEYQFTVDNLDEFTGFKFKIVCEWEQMRHSLLE